MKFFNKVEAVFFDWDGTLVNTVPFGLSVMNRFLSRRGKHEIKHKTYLSSPSLSVRDAFRSIFPPQEYDDAVREFKLFLDQQTQEFVPFNDAQNLLNFLYLGKIPMGVVSNQYGDVLRRQIKTLGWESYFSQITGSGDCEEDKPSSLPLIRALENTRIKPSTAVLFVGDSLVDMVCAEKAGCLPVAIGSQTKTFQGNCISFGSISDFYAEIRRWMEDNFLGEK